MSGDFEISTHPLASPFTANTTSIVRSAGFISTGAEPMSGRDAPVASDAATKRGMPAAANAVAPSIRNPRLVMPLVFISMAHS